MPYKKEMQQPVSYVMAVSDWTVLLLISSVSAQYYGNGYYGRYGFRCPLPLSPVAAGYLSGLGYGSSMYGMNVDPYNAANAYAMAGMVVDPAVRGMCVDTNAQCPIWASTGQCATNGMIMRRMCALSCGTCGLGMEYGVGLGPEIGLGYGGYGMPPVAPGLLGRSIYEQGILRSPTRTKIYPQSGRGQRAAPDNVFLPERN
ncbi:hypothetical protein Aduo_011531 [Ancylostoma duodenale]